MSAILDISIAVPEYAVDAEELIQFYEHSLKALNCTPISSKLKFLSRKTKIRGRYSCIPDFKGKEFELFKDEEFVPGIEARTDIYKQKILPLASRAIDELFENNTISASDVTHLITVSCTGVFAPGLEFLIAEKYGLQHTEKLALNFLGCYAAIKAIKHAQSIGQADPEACILIVCAELCSLHFYPSLVDEDIIANLLFADGASALFVCGEKNKHLKNKDIFKIDQIGSAYIPGTFDLMTWNVSSAAFRMYLDKEIVTVLRDNIKDVVDKFLIAHDSEPDYWAIHPGGVRIVEAVKDALGLSENNIRSSLEILEEYGNMSSPTILFILQRIMNEIRNSDEMHNQNIFACAFGPGLSVEMIQLSAITKSSQILVSNSDSNYVV